MGGGGRSRLLARVRVRAGKDAAEVRPALRVLNEQGEMATVIEVDLGAMDRPQSQRPGA